MPGGLGALLGEMSPEALNEGIGKVLSDPQMMARLPEVLEMIRPLMGGAEDGGGAESGGESSERAAEKTAEKSAETASEKMQTTSRAVREEGRGAHERRIALLNALRPYLSPRRREAIDYILRMDRMGKLFRNG